jgi:hypothetical protein
MAGQIKQLIDSIIAKRSQGNRTIALSTQTKIILKGIDPKRYDASSDDDPEVMAKIKVIAAELGVNL